ncbi:hypothetical protein EYZ11_008064 [Aspergillus tanneri]|uniref:Dehydrogenase E1 component domain-containing protein n=1 Tax=Aspergillus tanneri TaxID=1220188 RepID=A0A4S3JBF1_9EURO|nr:uncharacterized protein ATNIH1004_008440 [Aspergillus tanneri]KAA8644241.1 hypothetical protein ATNIH1004_008440 [Aspergillus tanneri]THC92473.1 hypothetical protein EYZ11_008064 [Aspergillus tanneri]
MVWDPLSRASDLTEYYKRDQYIPGLQINAIGALAVFSAVGPSDPGTAYRSRDELQTERADFKERLVQCGVITNNEAKAVDKDVREMVNKELSEAENMPDPEPRMDILFVVASGDNDKDNP